MRLTVNGEDKQVSAQTLTTLLAELDYAGTHYAIALNYDVVPRPRWAQTLLSDGDAVEILSPRQGG